MSIIYAPIIGDTIPAFNNSTIIIPFKQNIAVDKSAVNKIKIKILHYKGQEAEAQYIESASIDYDTCCITCHTPNNLMIGEYYKFQIAYIDKENNISPYSSIAIGRYIGQVLIADTAHGNTYYLTVTTYISEPIYKYQFTIVRGEDEFQILNEQIHNSSKDDLNYKQNTRTTTLQISIDNCGSSTFVGVSFTTINGYLGKQLNDNKLFSDPKTDSNTIKPICSYEKLYRDYGVVSLEGQTAGNSVLYRRDYDEIGWKKIINFKNTNTSFHFFDYTIENGKVYSYAIAEEGLIPSQGTRIGPIEFEDIQLSDKDEMLRIVFNPKISNVKDTILEQKIDTIGSKYPFFFRNGSVRYKEFSISGLLSHLSANTENMDTNLSLDNFIAEREFRERAYAWLTNGKPKLFRSPTEGNLIIKLVNVTLTPEEKLGRIISSFNATAYEIDEYNLDNLRKYDILPMEFDNA